MPMDDVNENQIDDADEAKLGMTEIDGFDFERAVILMNVMEKCANIGVKSTSIGGLAAAALNEMNEDAKAIAKRRAVEFEKAEQRAGEQRAAEARKREEAEQAEKEETDEAARVARPRAIPSEPTQVDVGRRL